VSKAPRACVNALKDVAACASNRAVLYLLSMNARATRRLHDPAIKIPRNGCIA